MAVARNSKSSPPPQPSSPPTNAVTNPTLLDLPNQEVSSAMSKPRGPGPTLLEGLLCQSAVGTPMRAFVERLSLVSPEECPWKSFLPKGCRDRESCQAVLMKAREESAKQLGELGESSVLGRVWQLSRDATGCRLVQSALDKAESDEARSELSAELQGHVWEALHCPHANHVLQKAVVVLRPEGTDFIIHEMLQRANGPVLASRHKYGCRVVQRLIEYCPPDQTSELVDSLLKDLLLVSRHPYGNYVIQKVLQHGKEEHKQQILASIRNDVPGFASDANAAAVLGAALRHCGEAVAKDLATALIEKEEQGLLVAMACSRLGHASIGHVLEALSPENERKGLQQLHDNAETLKSSRFGLQVLENLPSVDSLPDVLHTLRPS